MLRCGDQLRLTKREVEILSERVRFVPEGIRTEGDLRDWFARVKLYYSRHYGAGTTIERLVNDRIDQELSRLLIAA
jgi:hypothetical protein